jgi:cytochrome c551/c552
MEETKSMQTHAANGVAIYRDAAQAATRLGHATYTGTVSPATRGSVTAYADSAEAASRLGHATYTGTVSPATRRPFEASASA